MQKPALTPIFTLALAFLLTLPSTVLAKEAGDWIVRAGFGHVDPKSPNGTLDGTESDITVDAGSSLIFDITYMLSSNWAVELLAAAPFKHDVNIEGLGKVGTAKHLPPTLSGQYHFEPIGNIQPYLGLGFNVTTFFDEQTQGALAGTSLKLDNSFGFAAQAGVDIEIGENLLLNAVIRYIDIETDASVNGSEVARVKIDPVVYGLNLGYRF